MDKTSETQLKDTNYPTPIESEEETVKLDNDSEEGDEERKSEVRAIVSQVISEYSGPIPPPSIMSGYENLLPGASDRILRMAEEQAEHRRNMERMMVESEVKNSRLGIISALAICFSVLLVALLMVLIVPNAAGVIVGGLLGASGLTSIVFVFIRETKVDHK